ncbi:TIGR00289 family protein [Candidatus Woesearchaeota archaeon CG10_big_fil_rev_8_21_14_0_10_37_12]|nr:MAG: TIGR00289 family protein [Candidatus Woesearchaeota archaeon CG10_big_fil_rev_8_21_14_0_10_37_12]
MKLGILYSGGKDSTLALVKARKNHEIACLITVVSENPHSFMFQTPNIHMTELQAKAMGLQLVQVQTKGEKEKELVQLKQAIQQAKKIHKIGGIVTGAVRSTYQASRMQRICHELDLWCFNPLWLKDQGELLDEVLQSKIKAIIGGVFAEHLDELFLGKEIDKKMVDKLKNLAETHKINAAGEGGEIETTVLDCPLFKKKIKIEKAETLYENYSGTYAIIDAKLVKK